eukprot:6169041-Prymnesium_polylepis.1
MACRIVDRGDGSYIAHVQITRAGTYRFVGEIERGGDMRQPLGAVGHAAGDGGGTAATQRAEGAAPLPGTAEVVVAPGAPYGPSCIVRGPALDVLVAGVPNWIAVVTRDVYANRCVLGHQLGHPDSPHARDAHDVPTPGRPQPQAAALPCGSPRMDRPRRAARRCDHDTARRWEARLDRLGPRRELHVPTGWAPVAAGWENVPPPTCAAQELTHAIL